MKREKKPSDQLKVHASCAKELKLLFTNYSKNTFASTRVSVCVVQNGDCVEKYNEKKGIYIYKILKQKTLLKLMFIILICIVVAIAAHNHLKDFSF